MPKLPSQNIGENSNSNLEVDAIRDRVGDATPVALHLAHAAVAGALGRPEMAARAGLRCLSAM